MSDLKTKKNAASVRGFLDGIEDLQQRKDCRVLAKLMRQATGKRASMWGDAIVGFGSYHDTYASGRQGDWFLLGFSKFASLLTKLGKHKTGKSCLYVKRLDDIDLEILEELFRRSVAALARG